MSYTVTQTFDGAPSRVREKAIERDLSIATQTTMVIDDEDTLELGISYLEDGQRAGLDIGFDTEATSARAATAELIGLSFAITHDRGMYIPVGHVTGEEQLPLDYVLGRVAPLLGGSGLVMANGKYDWQLMKRHGVDVKYGKDSQVYSRLLGDIEWGVGLKPTMARLFSEACVEYSDLVTKKAPTLGHIEIGEVAKYAGADAINVLRCVHEMEKRLPNEIKEFLLGVEEQMMRIAGDMEYNGAPVDRVFVERHIIEGEAMVERLYGETIDKLKLVATKVGNDPDDIPTDLNLNSAPQIRKALFTVCKFPVAKRSKKTKNPSADKGAIAKMATIHHEVEWLGRYRSAESRVNDLKELIEFGVADDEWWFVHGGLNPTRAATGRWGSSSPNLQNISKDVSVYEGDRFQWEIRLRDAFMAPPGYYLITADYSQVELRVAAGESGCRTWVDAFTEGTDVHVATAAAAFGVAPALVSAKMRQQGKTLNFSMLFGAGEANVAEQMGITVEAARQLINAFWASLPEVTAWKNEVETFAKENGYAVTHFGRRRYLSGINAVGSKRAWYFSEAMREALNTVVQGTAADILKIGLLRAEDTWKGLNAKLWLVVHDQYVWSVPEAVSPREFCTAVDPKISFPIPGYPEIVSDYSIGKRFGSLISFESISAIPEIWEGADSADFTTGETGEAVLRIEVDRMFDPADLLSLLKANPGSRQVRVVSEVPEIAMILERTTSLTAKDALAIMATTDGAKVSLEA